MGKCRQSPLTDCRATLPGDARRSTVRDAIGRYRPTVALHGHIHEAQGVCRIGQTRCFNPGSDYSSGVLKGIVVDLDAQSECCSYVFTAG